jgi:hypothetical protein
MPSTVMDMSFALVITQIGSLHGDGQAKTFLQWKTDSLAL